jgi:hypothetical protein
LNRNTIISVGLGLVVPLFVTCAVALSLGNQSWGRAFFVVWFCCPLAAAFFGHAAKRDLSKSGRSGSRASKLATIAIAVAYFEVALLGLNSVMSGHHPAQEITHEISAVNSLRTLNFAITTYGIENPRVGFPKALSDLRSNGRPDADWSIDRGLMSSTKSAYRFTYVAKEINPDGVVNAFQVFADPLDEKNKGWRHFFTDQTGVVRQSIGVPANESSVAIQ